MKKYILFLLLLPCLVNASEADIGDLVDSFVELSDITKVKGAAQSDIDAVAALLSDEMRYQHPNYSADLSKSEFVEGLVNYMGVADSLTSKVVNKIVGDKAVTIAIISTTVMNGKTEIDPKPLMRLFEVNNGKITLIKEYW